MTVTGLTFRRGRATGDAPDTGSGGAIARGWKGTLYVADCHFEDNVSSSTTGAEVGGGAIYGASGGRTTVVGSTFARNRGNIGGAIDNLLSDLTLVDVAFDANTATDAGGALYTDGGIAEATDASDKGTKGRLSLCGARFTKNTSVKAGGAAFLFAYGDDRITIEKSSFVGNECTSDEGLGGAIRASARFAASTTTFEGNRAGGQGGALWLGEVTDASLTNVTAYRNVAESADKKQGYGGVFAGSGPLRITSSTFAENRAGWTGGALFVASGVTLNDTLLVDNSASNGGNTWRIDQTCSDALAGDHNLEWPGHNASAAGDADCTAGSIVENPRVTALADNGGVTKTVALTAGSPAIDKGDPASCAPLDQRGRARAGVCDIGAFELVP